MSTDLSYRPFTTMEVTETERKKRNRAKEDKKSKIYKTSRLGNKFSEEISTL